MGMYTEFVCAFSLNKDTPEQVTNLLLHMSGKLVQLPKLPEHELFRTERWEFMLFSDSYYFEGETHTSVRYDDVLGRYSVTIRCNLKNYDQEIEKFLDWIAPHISSTGFLGYMRHEASKHPDLIYKDDENIKYMVA